MNNENTYADREIEEMFADVKEALQRIERQTTQTNGRVSALENWKWFISGGLAILSMLFVPVLLKIFV